MENQCEHIQDVDVLEIFKPYHEVSSYLWNLSKENVNTEELIKLIIDKIETRFVSPTFIYNLIFVITMYRPHLSQIMNVICKSLCTKYKRVYREVSFPFLTKITCFRPTELNNILLNDDVDEYIQYLTRKFANPDILDLQASCLYGSINCFKYIIMNLDKDLETAKYYAIISGNLEMIRILYNSGVSFDKCYRMAVVTNRNEIADWIYDNFGDNESNVFEALVVKNYQAVSFYMNNGVNPEDLAFNPIMVASQENSPEIIEYFMTKGFAIEESQGNDGDETAAKSMTPLIIACRHGSLEAVKFLISSGVNINTGIRAHSRAKFDEVAKISTTPLITSIFSHNTDIAKALIENGANVEAKALLEDEGQDSLYMLCSEATALTAAIITKNLDLIKFLLDHGADKENGVYKQTLDGMHKELPYDIAMRNYFKEAIDLLAPKD